MIVHLPPRTPSPLTLAYMRRHDMTLADWAIVALRVAEIIALAWLVGWLVQ